MRGELGDREVRKINRNYIDTKGAPINPKNSRRKVSNFEKRVAEYFYDYSSNTSIQGVKYLGEKNRNIFEKLFWLIFLSTSIFLCAYLTNKVYRKWQNAPVIVTFSNNMIPVWEIPFPAVTICPEAKSRRSLYNYTDSYVKFQSSPNDLTEEELKRFEQMNDLCGDSLLPNGSATVGNDTIDFLLNIAPTCDEWLCAWNDDSQECNTLLTPTLTEDGVCFTLNMLDRAELFTSSSYYYKNFYKHGLKSTNWSLEKGYAGEVAPEDYPRRTSAGSQIYFVAMVNYEPDLDYGCRGDVQGYKVLLHHPADIPGLNHMALIASFDTQMLITIKPEMMTTSSELNSYHPEQRQCYFSYERQLKYFQVYTQSNCELECLTNYTLKQCGCVSFYMPRNITTDICGRANYICTTTARKMMVIKEIKRPATGHYRNEFEEKCNCLPSCISLTYDTETSNVAHKWKNRLEVRNVSKDVSNLAVTQIYFFFKAQYFIPTERKELYGLMDFVANCGGLLGLFIGFSFLSIAEIIYFLTIRLICSIKIRGHRIWSGSPESGLKSNIFASGEPYTIFEPPLKNNAKPKHDLRVINLE